jgi:hypothetical protein
MKKYVILFIFLITYSWASEILDLVQQLISTDSFRENRTLIEKIFINEDRFRDPEGNLDLHEILRKLNTNGILKLFLHKPQSIHISFNSNGNSKFFLKLIFDSLEDLGYSKYRVLNIKKDDDGIKLEIDLTSDYILDPTLFYESLAQKGCKIISIKRDSHLSWEYYINISTGFLNTKIIFTDDDFKFFKDSYSDYWLKVDESAKKLIIKSVRGNHWHPYITFYDFELNILKIYKEEKRKFKFNIPIPKGTFYCRITDIYRLNNIHNGLEIKVTH